MKNTIDADQLLELAVAFDLGEHRIGEFKTHVMLIRVTGGWNLRATLGPMNVWGLKEDGVWKYKGFATFANRNEAVRAFNDALADPKWDKGEKPSGSDEKDW